MFSTLFVFVLSINEDSLLNKGDKGDKTQQGEGSPSLLIKGDKGD